MTRVKSGGRQTRAVLHVHVERVDFHVAADSACDVDARAHALLLLLLDDTSSQLTRYMRSIKLYHSERIKWSMAMNR